MAKLKKMLTHPGKNESGQGVLAIVLLLLMLGAIILTPLLVFMSTGVKAGQVYESKLQEFYAADAGVEDAIWNIKNESFVSNYSLGENVNNRTINVTIEPISGGGYSGYKIISTATSDSGGNTTIECCYGAFNYSSLLDNAITTNETLKLQPNLNITGNISTPDCSEVEDCDFSCTGCPDWTCCVDCPNCTSCCSEEPLSWPTAEQLSAWYWDRVKGLPSFPDPGEIDITEYPYSSIGIGPLYRNGTLDIYNGGSAGKNATLNGTVYVTGDLKIGKKGKDFTLNLNNQTIFVKSNTTGAPYAILVGKNVQIIGSGCIIAVGDVYFEPKGDVGSNTTFVFIMSIEGTVQLQPLGDFYGAVAGNAEVNLQPNNVLVWTSYEGKGIDFPIGQSMMKVLSYTIK